MAGFCFPVSRLEEMKVRLAEAVLGVYGDGGDNAEANAPACGTCPICGAELVLLDGGEGAFCPKGCLLG